MVIFFFSVNNIYALDIIRTTSGVSNSIINTSIDMVKDFDIKVTYTYPLNFSNIEFYDPCANISYSCVNNSSDHYIEIDIPVLINLKISGNNTLKVSLNKISFLGEEFHDFKILKNSLPVTEVELKHKEDDNINVIIKIKYQTILAKDNQRGDVELTFDIL